MATIEERFQAAVNVIKGLPKNGPYQPSTTMMLKFYGYYKQATEGPCPQKKPSFWDIIGKAKWDAWNGNRHLTKEQAMKKYVDELREIIETMSFTENVQNFVGSISGLDNINLDELEMIAPGVRELAESHPSSPFNSRTNSPQHGVSANTPSTEVHVLNGHATLINDNETPPPTPPIANGLSPSPPQALVSHSSSMVNGTVEQSDDEYGDPLDMQNDLSEVMMQNTELLKQIKVTVLRMNTDIASVNQRMTVLEKLLQQSMQRSAKFSGVSRVARYYANWWPFENISPAWFAVLVLWPFVVRRLLQLILNPRRK